MTHLTERDWEALSAYIDNQIGERDLTVLESRLQSEPALASALEDLRNTRLILSSAPKFKAPRNFTLTPQMAGRGSHAQSFPPIYPVLRLTAVLATIFFVLISAGNLTLQFSSSAEPVVVSSQFDSAQTAPQFGKGGGGGGQEGLSTPLPLPTQDAAELEAERENAQLAGKALKVTPQDEPLSTSTQDQVQAFLAPEEPPAAELPQPEREPIISVQSPAAEVEDPRQSVRSLVKVLQILLAALALITGTATIYMRRQKRY